MQKQENKPDFSQWVAIQRKDDPGRWAIAPKAFWDANSCVPDWRIGFSVPGFYEVGPHALAPKMSQHEPRAALVGLGFTVIDE